MDPDNPDRPPPHFTRTTCACERCVRCCKEQPGPLAPGDFERIVAYIAETQKLTPELAFETAKKQFVASAGALVADFFSGKIHRVGTITPRFKKGRCVFLDENDRCSIHPVAPFGCAYFDTHMTDWEADPRSTWLVKQQSRGDYQRLRNTLPVADNYLKQRNKQNLTL